MTQPATGGAHSIQIYTSKSPSSPNTLHHKSKRSRSKRLNVDPHETPPLSGIDYFWLFVYYVCLYLFFILFWYLLWFIYTLTLPKDGPRIPHPKEVSTLGYTNFGLSFLPSCNNST